MALIHVSLVSDWVDTSARYYGLTEFCVQIPRGRLLLYTSEAATIYIIFTDDDAHSPRLSRVSYDLHVWAVNSCDTVVAQCIDTSWLETLLFSYFFAERLLAAPVIWHLLHFSDSWPLEECWYLFNAYLYYYLTPYNYHLTLLHRSSSHAPYGVHVPQNWKPLEATLEEWHPAHSTPEEPQREFTMKEGRNWELVRSILSVSFAFFMVKVVGEDGWCSVESRAQISGFTHFF